MCDECWYCDVCIISPMFYAVISVDMGSIWPIGTLLCCVDKCLMLKEIANTLCVT